MKRILLTVIATMAMVSTQAQGVINRPAQKQPAAKQQTTVKKSTVTKKSPAATTRKPTTVKKPIQSEAAGYDFTFYSNVPSAQLYIDGNQNGTASGTRFLKTGTHSIRLTANGYEDLVATINVNSQSQSVSLTMVKRQSSFASTSSSSANMLKGFIERPVGRLNVDLASFTTSFSTIESVMRQNYNLNSNSQTGKCAIVYAHENPSLDGITYNGLPFRYFRANVSSYLYVFEISKKNMTMGIYDYLDKVVADFNALGIPMRYDRKYEQYDKAYGSVTVGNKRYVIEITEYSVCVQYTIWVFKN